MELPFPEPPIIGDRNVLGNLFAFNEMTAMGASFAQNTLPAGWIHDIPEKTGLER